MMSCSLLLPAAATTATFLLTAGSDAPIAFLASLAISLLCVSLISVLKEWMTVFVTSVGVLIVIDVFLVVLLSDSSVIVSWSILAAGIVALMLGADSMSMWGMVRVQRRVDPAIEEHFRRAIRRSVSSTLLFIVAVMAISIIALAISLGLEMRGFSFLFLALCVVAAMVTLTLLAAGRMRTNP